MKLKEGNPEPHFSGGRMFIFFIESKFYDFEVLNLMLYLKKLYPL